jgi:hypothetical protein
MTNSDRRRRLWLASAVLPLSALAVYASLPVKKAPLSASWPVCYDEDGVTPLSCGAERDYWEDASGDHHGCGMAETTYCCDISYGQDWDRYCSIEVGPGGRPGCCGE